MYRLSWLCLKLKYADERETDKCLYIICMQVLKGQKINMQPTVIKGIGHPKILFCHYLLTHMLSQTCINLFHVLNTEYI